MDWRLPSFIFLSDEVSDRSWWVGIERVLHLDGLLATREPLPYSSSRNSFPPTKPRTGSLDICRLVAFGVFKMWIYQPWRILITTSDLFVTLLHFHMFHVLLPRAWLHVWLHTASTMFTLIRFVGGSVNLEIGKPEVWQTVGLVK